MVVTRRSANLNCTALKELQSSSKGRRVSTRSKRSTTKKRLLLGDTENTDKISGSPEILAHGACNNESNGLFGKNIERNKRDGIFAVEINKLSSGAQSTIEEAGDCRISNLSEDSPDDNPLIGREEEYNKISLLLKKNLSAGTSLSIYISGPPGTGKTATVRNVLENLTTRGSIHFLSATVNCVSYSNENDIFREICRKFGKSKKNVPVSQLQKEIGSIFASAKVPIVIVLDEIDGVRTKNNFFHYCVFQWPEAFSKVSLIGIANSLDLTVRVLPKLKLLRSPELLTFSPYTKNILKEIIKRKLSSERIKNSDGAIELCSRKVAAMTGDVRTAVHIARQMITQISEDSINNSNNNGLVQLANKMSDISVSSAKKACLPLQQKIILAIILRLSQLLHSSTVKKDLMQQAYDRVRNLLRLPLLNNNELCSALSLLEARMIVNCIDTAGYKLLLDTPSVKRIIGDESLIVRVINISEEKLLGI